MKKIQVVFFLLFAVSSVSSQDLTIEEKVDKLLRQTKTIENLETTINKVINAQKQLDPSERNQRFWDMYLEKYSKDDYLLARSALRRNYLEFFNEDEIDQLIQFYDSELGQKLILFSTDLLSGSMDVGSKIGQEISLEILEVFQAEDEEKFDKQIEGCENFRTGTFTYLHDEDTAVTVVRTDSIQTESIGSLEIKLQIEWIGACKYILRPINEAGKLEENPSRISVSNIYEIQGNNCKTITTAKNEKVFTTSELTKIND